MLTVEQAVKAHFAPAIDDGTYIDPGANDRLRGHDILHTLLDASPNTSRGEEIVAIYQAVLLGDPSVDRRKREWCEGGDEVTLTQVREQVMPGIRRYLKWIESEYGAHTQPVLTDTDIAEHHAAAVRLRGLIRKQFQRNLGEISIDELEAMPVEPLRELVRNAQNPGMPDDRMQSPPALAGLSADERQAGK